MANRILVHLCDCQRKRTRDERLMRLMDDLHECTGDLLQMMHKDGVIHVDVMRCFEPIEPADAASVLAGHLRALSVELAEAAANLEGGSV